MHRNPHDASAAYTGAYAADTISRVPNQPKTPNRAIRVEDGLWRDYGEACEEEGTTRSDDLRAHMLRKVRARKRRQEEPRDRRV
jgi:hypothetical protein